MKRLIFAILLFPSLALAQANPQEQIERTIGNLVVTNASLNSQLAQAQVEIADLKKKIKELETKPAEKK